MTHANRAAALLLTVFMCSATSGVAQSNPYQRVDAPTPPPHMNGGEWGELIQVRVGPDGNVFVLHRCFKAVLGDPRVAPGHSDGLSADCFGRWAVHPPILKFAPSGEFLASFGVGIVGRPHGFTVDHEGNMWMTDVAVVPIAVVVDKAIVSRCPNKRVVARPANDRIVGS